MSYYVHHVPGRLRIKAVRLRCIECQAKLIKMLADLRGIASHIHNDKIGSVLIHYDTGQLSADDIFRAFASDSKTVRGENI